MPVKKSEIYSALWETCNKLRGGVEPARYKDYVLVLLFFKYISDKYNNDPFSEFTVPEGASFDVLIKAKGKKDVGEIVNKTLQKFLEANKLSGFLPAVSFENANELGTGKELIDKVSGLIGVFQNPALDFRSNNASGDDIIGDAYEYFMMKFAQESGKSKGQFYTPAEVSRIIARLIGIGNVKEKVTVYDPAAGSGSLLIRAADEAPVNLLGFSLASIYGQEIDISTAGLAKMNFILHQRGTGKIQKGNTLSDPKFLDSFGQLERFDFIVMNPPFSDKSWSDGVNTEADIYHRFEGFGIPPAKNGDYAWLLHVIKSLAPNGKAGIVLPHGVLFRGNAEEAIRINLLRTKYIKGIVSLPPNLFYGVGIPACLMFIDKENAPAREGVFFVDASGGFKKDGNKNRLREQDIERIVRVYNAQEEIEGYSRLVPYSEILEVNGGNMNVPRYIQKPNDTLPQNIAAHLNGGIPEYDINTLSKIWRISPALKKKIFALTDCGIWRIAVGVDDAEKIFEDDETLRAQKFTEGTEIFDAWKIKARESLLNIDGDTNPKILIQELGDSILNFYADTLIVDRYSVFDCLMNYWNETLQDDVYMIRAYAYESGCAIAYQYDKKGKITGFDGELIPREIIEREYFAGELEKIADLEVSLESTQAILDEKLEEGSGDDGLLVNIINEKGNVQLADITLRLKRLQEMGVVDYLQSDELRAIEEYLGYLIEKADINIQIKSAKKELDKRVQENIQSFQ
ncbi:MAG: SAM-dependent DNA methyltransferase [Synergistaceae bacterium]|nr:SAM-dependent DNA methyltransferase [Synergistaceae bacterium]